MAKVNWEESIQTADGRKARLLGVLAGKDRDHVVAVTDGAQELCFFVDENGVSTKYSDPKDAIVNVPKTIKVHVYMRDGDVRMCNPIKAVCEGSVAQGNGVIVELPTRRE